ncbi:Uncharacterised protein [uncultured archaeon]|nr:Uncharacterised protein [uncultured archaeon]
MEKVRQEIADKTEETRVRLKELMERDGIPGEPPKRVLPLDKVPSPLEIAAALHGNPPYDPAIALTAPPKYVGQTPDSVRLAQEFDQENYTPGRTYSDGELMAVVSYQYQFQVLYFRKPGE